MKLRAIPFSGAGETKKNFLGGHVDIYGGSIAPILGNVKEGTAKCVIVTTAERNAALPDAAVRRPILGLADKATELWRGLIGPPGLPADRVAALQQAFSQASQVRGVPGVHREARRARHRRDFGGVRQEGRGRVRPGTARSSGRWGLAKN